MDKKDLIQTAFLGFVTALFFEIFNFFINFLSSFQSYISLEQTCIRLIMLIFLISATFLFLGYRPDFFDILDKNLIDYLKKVGKWCFIIAFGLLILFMIISVINLHNFNQGVMNITNLSK
jgi:hypothetical protein